MDDASVTPQLFANKFDHAKQHEPARYVVCRECNWHFRRLNGGHLAAVHKLTTEEYLTRHPGAPIMCADLPRKASIRTKQQMEPLRGRPRPELKSVRGHVGNGALKAWPVICHVVQGYSYADLESEFHRDFGTIADCARKRGFSGKPCVYDLGRPFDKEAVQHLKNYTGLSATQMANGIGLPRSAIEELIKRDRAWQRIHPNAARKIIAWRDQLIAKLLATASKPSRADDRYSGSRILLTFFPDLPKKHKLLVNVLRKLRLFLLAQSEATEEQIGEHLCSEAMLETSRSFHARTFAEFLPWAPDLMPFLLVSCNSGS